MTVTRRAMKVQALGRAANGPRAATPSPSRTFITVKVTRDDCNLKFWQVQVGRATVNRDWT